MREEAKKILKTASTSSTSRCTDDDTSSLASSSSSASSSLGKGTTSPGTQRSILWTLLLGLIKFSIGLALFYHFLASPPVDWIYDPLPSVEGNTTTTFYLPGGGFSGLFYHLGVLHSLEDPQGVDYYCYSSGCLAAVAALTNLTNEQVVDAGMATQEEWLEGKVSIYDFSEQFVEKLLMVDEELLVEILPQIKVLMTSPWHGGTEVKQARTRVEFVDLMIKTTWLPYITGWGMLHEGRSMDGGFSRRLHPKCDLEVFVPIYWEITKKTFTPAISRQEANSFWKAGYAHELPGGTIARHNDSQLMTCAAADAQETTCQRTGELN